MSLRLPPSDRSPQEWIRKAAGIINGLLGRIDTLEQPASGDVRYQGGALEYYDGDEWQPVP